MRGKDALAILRRVHRIRHHIKPLLRRLGRVVGRDYFWNLATEWAEKGLLNSVDTPPDDALLRVIVRVIISFQIAELPADFLQFVAGDFVAAFHVRLDNLQDLLRHPRTRALNLVKLGNRVGNLGFHCLVRHNAFAAQGGLECVADFSLGVRHSRVANRVSRFLDRLQNAAEGFEVERFERINRPIGKLRVHKREARNLVFRAL